MRLCQVIALVAGKKTRAQKLTTTIHHGWKVDRISGLSRTYQPLKDGDDIFPSESRLVQVKVAEEIPKAQKVLEQFINLVATQETANTNAKADVVVKGKALLEDVPVTVILFLEKQLTDIRTMVLNVPTLPTDKVWTLDNNQNCYVTDPEETVKTKKKMKVIVKYPATPEHPAQTEILPEDVRIGHWTTIHLSGAMPEKERAVILERIEMLQDALKVAREEANSATVVPVSNLGQTFLNYIFTSK